MQVVNLNQERLRLVLQELKEANNRLRRSLANSPRAQEAIRLQVQRQQRAKHQRERRQVEKLNKKLENNLQHLQHL